MNIALSECNIGAFYRISFPTVLLSIIFKNSNVKTPMRNILILILKYRHPCMCIYSYTVYIYIHIYMYINLLYVMFVGIFSFINFL